MRSTVSERVIKNIEALRVHREAILRRRKIEERVADGITNFSGNMKFVYLHAAWFLVWIAINCGWTPAVPFDPYPFGLLTMIVSLEAIFLSTFVLISQNRISRMVEERAEMDLQINLLSEQEVTHLIRIADAIATKLGVDLEDGEMKEMEKEVAPVELLEEIEELEGGEFKSN